ncbi:hypothetical protein [Massilia sp.]|uniref:hypothetical protein n=1 Tax=Massilia sp. TaxID=1882437 RepID=UPI0028A7CAAE|nr:hypothetical protein [Massilia sp.]
MDRQLLLLILAMLAFGLAFNLYLSLSVLRRTRMERDPAAEPVPMPGDAAPRLPARHMDTRTRASLLPEGRACALLFLSTRCDKCRERLPQVAALLPAAAAAGLALRIPSVEPAFRLRRFLRGTPLAGAVWQLRTADYKRLNPRLASPAYLFVNHEGGIEAAGLIGDENWLGLVEQLSQAEVATMETAAA